MRPHRHDFLPEEALHPSKPVADVPLERQATAMRQLRAARNRVSAAYLERDELMAALGASNSLSRHDMAIATGLAKSRVDQIIRDTYARHRARMARGGEERAVRHLARAPVASRR